MRRLNRWRPIFRDFDPENEIQNMETEGSGWPGTGSGIGPNL